MRIEEPTLEEVLAFAREQLGLDIDHDRPEVQQLAAIGLTLRAWRNTSLEDLHAGSHPSGGFPDSQMMRFNVATFRVVSQYIGNDQFDWVGLRRALTDPNRELPGDLTVGELCGEEFDRLVADIEEALAIRHGLSNARVEAINTQIRLIARRAFGFHLPRGADLPGDAEARWVVSASARSSHRYVTHGNVRRARKRTLLATRNVRQITM